MDAFIFNFILGIVLIGLIVLTIVRKVNKSVRVSPMKCPPPVKCKAPNKEKKASAPLASKCPPPVKCKSPNQEKKASAPPPPASKCPVPKNCPVCGSKKRTPSSKCPACSIVFMGSPEMKRPLSGMELGSTTSPSMYQLYAYQYGTRPNF